METKKLPGKVHKMLDDFIQAVQNIYHDELVAAILYGSAASGEYSGKHSNVNIAIVLRNAGIHNVTKIAPVVKRRRFAAINPVFFTESYLKHSSDVFPIEFLDMKENHSLLYGKDVLKDIDIDIRNLRFQCEQELKSKIINFKRMFVKNTDRAILAKALFRLFTSSLHILRNVLRLKTGQMVYAKEDIIKLLTVEFKIDADAFTRIWDAKLNGLRLGYREAEGLLLRFVGDLENIADSVDAF